MEDIVEEDNETQGDEISEGEDFDGFGQRPSKKRSSFWSFFVEINVDGVKFAECTLCVDKATKYKISGKCNGSSGNMKRHIQNKHPDEFSTIESIDQGEKFVFSQDKFRAALLKWVVVRDQPYSEPQEQTFVEMINTLNPQAKTISDKTVQADMMATFAVKFEDLKKELGLVHGKISLALDLWTSKNLLSFMAIRGHWLDNDWTYRSKLFDFKHVKDKHSGENIGKIFHNCLTRLGLQYAKILGITVDNASNNNTFFDYLMSITDDISEATCHIRCLAHIINLAAQDILDLLKVPDVENEDFFDYENEQLDDIDLNYESEDELEDDDDDDDGPPASIGTAIIVKLRYVVKKIRKSHSLRQKLKKFCDIYSVKYLVPIMDVKSRWNSSYYMICRAEHLAIPLRQLCLNEKSLRSKVMSERDWEFLNEIQKILKKFDRATKLVSMQRHSNISSHLPTLNWLIASLKEFVENHSGSLATATEAGLLKLQKYELTIKESTLPFIATFLNPACKLNYFKEYYDTTDNREIRNVISQYFTEKYEPPTVPKNRATKRKLDESVESDDELYAHMFKRTKTKQFSSEFQKYIDMPLLNEKTDPIEFWKSQENEFPHLSRMARDFLPLQSGSVSVERDFSGAVDLITPTRCALTAKSIEADMCLKSWMK